MRSYCPRSPGPRAGVPARGRAGLRCREWPEADGTEGDGAEMPGGLSFGPAHPDLTRPADVPVRAHSSKAAQARRGDRDGFGWIGWLLVALAALGMAVSTPPSGGPDEPVQAVTAWYMSDHVLPPGSGSSFSAPASLWVQPCYAFQPTVTAGCMPARATGTVSVPTAKVVDYPPPYYWIVGAGQRLATLAQNGYADYGGRFASASLNLLTLLAVSVYMRRRNRLWGNFLVLASTPMSVFLTVVVNPSGWEISCAIAMAAVLSVAAWTEGHHSKETTAWLVLASIALSMARPLGFVWSAALTASAIALARPIRLRWQLTHVMPAIAPGVLVGMIWVLTHRQIDSSAALNTSWSALKYAHTFAESLMFFPHRLQAIFGDLGWLDTPMPGLLLYLNIGAWAALLTRLPAIPKWTVLIGLVGMLILPSGIELMGWAAWPLWWQGRYTLPFAAGFVLLLLLRSGRLVPRSVFAVSGVAVLSQGVMIWTNAVRHAYGLDGFGLPATYLHPGLSPVRLAMAAAIGGILVCVSAWVFVRAWRMKGDFSGDAAT